LEGGGEVVDESAGVSRSDPLFSSQYRSYVFL